jgi:hypothetical protein
VLQYLFHREAFADGAKIHEGLSCFGHTIILLKVLWKFRRCALARWNLV